MTYDVTCQLIAAVLGIALCAGVVVICFWPIVNPITWLNSLRCWVYVEHTFCKGYSDTFKYGVWVREWELKDHYAAVDAMFKPMLDTGWCRVSKVK